MGTALLNHYVNASTPTVTFKTTPFYDETTRNINLSYPGSGIKYDILGEYTFTEALLYPPQYVIARLTYKNYIQGLDSVYAYLAISAVTPFVTSNINYATSTSVRTYPIGDEGSAASPASGEISSKYVNVSPKSYVFAQDTGLDIQKRSSRIAFTVQFVEADTVSIEEVRCTIMGFTPVF